MPQPNLLFIYTDEQAAGTMAAYGNALIETPNMDRLAGEGVVFERAYVTQPVCTPSRSTLLTGLWPHQSGCTENNVPLRPETPCLPELADLSGYRTGHFGKWHLGDEVFAQHGFDEWVSIDDGYRGHYSEGRDRGVRSSYFHWLVGRGFEPTVGGDGSASFSRGSCARLPEELSKPAYLAGEASRFLRENRRGRPFMLFVNFFEPHMPYTGPRDGQYDPADVPLPPNFDAAPGPEQPLKLRLFRQHYARHGHSGLRLATEDHWRRLIANYWGLCSQVDTHLGTLLDTLEECGLAADTVVVYTSDHGDMMGSHGLTAKCAQYEEAVRVPLMIRGPGIAPGRVEAPVSHIDVVPTLLDLLGRPAPGSLPGRSLGPSLADTRCAPGRDVFVQWNGPNSGLGDVVGGVSLPEGALDVGPREDLVASICDPVRTIVSPDGWKLNCSPLGEHELYDLTEDPGETRNLVREPAFRDRAQELLDRIRDWQAEVADPPATVASS